VLRNYGVVDDAEMKEILKYEKDLKQGLADVNAGRYTIIG
jgi:hypothetical protein